MVYYFSAIIVSYYCQCLILMFIFNVQHSFIHQLLHLLNLEDRAHCTHPTTGVQPHPTGGEVENVIVLTLVGEHDDIG